MNLSEKIKERFKQNLHMVRHISENGTDGIFACGYLQKNTRQGSHIDYETNSYHGLMILSGEGIYKDKIMGEIPIHPGSFVQRFPGRKHSTIVTSDDWAEIYVCLGNGIFQQLSSLGVINKDKPVLSTGLDFILIEGASEYIERFERADNVELLHLIPEAIEIISRANYLDKINAHPSEVLEMLEQSITYIEENISNRFEVQDVAEWVHVGFEKFRKLFTSHYGVAPGHYIIQRRIHHAQKLLSENKLSIKEIANILGYSDAYSFSKQFRNTMGMSPTDYKRSYIL